MSIRKHTTKAGRTSWRVSGRIGTGRAAQQVTRAFGTRDEAVAYEAELARLRQLGAHAPQPASRERLDVWLEAWFRSGCTLWAPATRTNRASHLDCWVRPYIGNVPMRDLGAGRLRQWRDDIAAAGASASTVSNVMRTLSAALTEAARDGLIPSNPLAGMPRPRVVRKPRRALSALQVEAIRAQLPTVQDRVLWGLLAAAGLRPEEALAVRWCDITDGHVAVERVYVSGEFRDTTKTGRFRDVPVVPTLADDLAALRELAAGGDDGLVVANRNGGPVNIGNWRRRVFDPACARAGTPWAIPYSGRHTYCTLQIYAGLPVTEVARLAGHGTDVCLKHYAREFDRARSKHGTPLATALAAARAEVAGAGGGVPVLYAEGAGVAATG